MDNKYEKLSKLVLKTKSTSGTTFLSDAEFTAPFKIMKPFIQKDGTILVMVQMASAGLLEGDEQSIEIDVGENSHLILTHQSYEKIHAMHEGHAQKRTNIIIGKNASFYYKALPTIPFASSSYAGTSVIKLESETSNLLYREIIACGRIAMDEKFDFQSYRSNIKLYKKNHLVYYDNTYLNPNKMRINDMGFFEGYTHLLSIISVRFNNQEEKVLSIRRLIEIYNNIAGGVTLTDEGVLIVKVLGTRADVLVDLSDEIAKLVQ